MANGQIFHNCTIKWNGDDISGQVNRVEITRERPTASWTVFGTDVLQKDQAERNESVRLSLVYTEGASEAYAKLDAAFTATGGGTAGTLTVTPVASGSVFTAVGKVASMPSTIPTSEAGAFEAVIEPSSGLTWGTA